MNISILQLVVVLLACAVIVVSLARLAHLPALLGYLVLGAPRTFSLSASIEF